MILLRNGVLISKRAFLINTLLFTFLFTLYFVLALFIPRFIVSSDALVTVQVSLSFVIAIALIASSHLTDQTKKLVSLSASSIVIMVASILLLLVDSSVVRLMLLFATGIFFSLGLLSFVANFWKTTVPEERGRISGLVGVVALPFNFAVTYLIAPSLDLIGTVTLGIIIALAILLVGLLNRKQSFPTTKKAEMNYSEKRTIILYSIPWIVFSLVNVTLAKNASTWISQQVPASFHLLLLGIQFVGVILGCFLGGIVADFFGRRVSLFLSLTSYGVSAALIGLFTSDSMLPAIYTINGLSWGILFTLYIFVIWSDLANEDNIGKMFSIGFATYYLSIGFGLLLPISIPIFASSLATCFLIFLCNLPIAIAPELLSPTFRDKIKIKLHIEAVKKIGKKQKTKPSRH